MSSPFSILISPVHSAPGTQAATVGQRLKRRQGRTGAHGEHESLGQAAAEFAEDPGQPAGAQGSADTLEGLPGVHQLKSFGVSWHIVLHMVLYVL